MSLPQFTYFLFFGSILPNDYKSHNRKLEEWEARVIVTWWSSVVAGCFLWQGTTLCTPSCILGSISSITLTIQNACFKKKKKIRNTSSTFKCFRPFFFFLNCCRHLLVIRHWHFDWWMQRCIQTWVCSRLLLQLLIVEYSFIKWFGSLLMHLEERAIWTSWVSNLRSKSFILSSTECLAGK